LKSNKINDDDDVPFSTTSHTAADDLDIDYFKSLAED